MAAPTRYTGPRPSPARLWAPWVIGGAVLIALSNVAQCGLNLLERYYQQHRLSEHPPSAAHVRVAVDTVRTLTTLTAILVLAWSVVALIWANQRRPRARLRAYGESSVEPALRRISPPAWFAMGAALAIGLIASFAARGAAHPVMSVDDFVRYRGWLAAGNLGRGIAWTCWALLAVRSTAQQSRREAVHRPTSRAVPEPPRSVPEPWAASRV